MKVMLLHASTLCCHVNCYQVIYMYMYTHVCIHASLGDTIESVNGHTVSLENIDSILAGVSNEVCNSLLY